MGHIHYPLSIGPLHAKKITPVFKSPIAALHRQLLQGTIVISLGVVTKPEMRLSWVLPLSAALPVWTASTGKFNVLSFNIAGLPAIFNSNGVPGDKSTNAETIGTKFAQYGYDVIQVQEVSCMIFFFFCED